MLSTRVNVICLIAAILAGSAKTAQAQIIPDNTLGNEASQVTIDATVQGSPTDLIEGGAARGANLFHSFSDFNVADLQRVYFANPSGIDNILSRVTGGNQSNILGTLGVDGGANLFLLNPNGIVLGTNAQLDISGSFFASTADAFELDEGLSYSAIEPTAPPLLAVTLTPGLQYGVAQQGEIFNVGILQTGEALTLNANTLTLNGSVLAGADLSLYASDTIQIRDSEVQPFVAAAIGDVLVQGDQTVDIFALNHPESGLFAGQDLILRSANSIIGDTYYWSGNRFQVETLDGLPGNLLSPNDPVIQSGGDISFANYTGASLRVLAGGSVTANNITITGTDPGFPDEVVTLSRPLADGTTTVQVNGSIRPVVDIRAGTTAATGGLTCDNCPSFLGIILQPSILSSSATPTSAHITVGNIAINPSNGLVLLTNQSQPDISLVGNIQVQGIDTRNTVAEGGDIILDSRGSIILPIATSIRSSAISQDSGDISLIAQDAVNLAEEVIVQSASGGIGRGGDINVLAGSLSLLQEARLDASTTGNGDAGDSGEINIDVTNTISLTGFDTRINNSVDSNARANASDINIRANTLSIEDGAGIFSSMLGEGNGGRINLDISGAIVLDGKSGGSNSAIATGVGDTGSGNGGQINLRADSLSLTNGGLITSLTASNNSISNAGDINLNVRDFILIEGDAPVDAVRNASPFAFSNNSSISAGSVGNGSTSNGGTVTVNTDQLLVQDGGVISTIHTGQGQGGNIELNARIINFSGSSERFYTPSAAATVISADATAGNITLNTNEISITDGAAVVTTTEGTGNGGDIEIATNSLSLLNGGQVLSNATDVGNAGNINVENTENITISGSDPSFFIRSILFSLDNPGSNLINVSADSGLYASSSSTGNSGEISISDVDVIDIRDRGRITTFSEGTGDAGSISIANTESITLDGNSEISTSSFNAGESGTLAIETNILSLRNNSGLITAAAGSGNAGQLDVQANLVELINGSRITTDTGPSTLLGIIFSPNSTGNAGRLNIDTNRLVLQDGEISASASITSSGQAGVLTINALESIDISGIDGTNTGGLFASSLGTGEGGEVIIRTGNLTIQDGGRIESGSAGLGQGGSVDVFATDSITISGTSAALTGLEIAGLLDLTGLVDITEGSDTRTFLRSGISAFSLDQGNADSGNVRVATNGNLVVQDNAEITTAVLGGGDANNVQISANFLELQNSARINSRNEGTGLAGDISVGIQEFFQSTGGEVSASSDSAGGGDIKITTDNLLLRNGSLLSTSVFDSTGGGGNIEIEADAFAAIEDSDILANAEFGPGGSIDINSPAFLAALFSSGRATPVGRNPGSFAQFRGNGRVDISAESVGGEEGEVLLPELVTDEGLNEFPINLIDPTSLIDQRCALLASQQSQDNPQDQDNPQTNRFTIVGQGGLPLIPEQQLEATQLLDDLGPQAIQPTTENSNTEIVTIAQPEASSEHIVEPLGWRRSEDGRLYLYSSVPNNAETLLAQRCAGFPSANISSVSSR